jgi:DUF2905 family protein
MEFQSLGKWLIGVGLMIVLAGAALQILPRIPYLGRLPGDILIKRDNFTFYFPLATCLVISVFLTLIAHIFGRK